MGGRTLVALALLLAVPLGCARAPSPDRCEVKIVRVESYDRSPGELFVAYRVSGEAGSPGKVWLAAKRVEGDYLSGGALEVGPGAFHAVVDLKLTGVVPEYVVVLEVAGRRCSARSDAPRR